MNTTEGRARQFFTNQRSRKSNSLRIVFARMALEPIGAIDLRGLRFVAK